MFNNFHFFNTTQKEASEALLLVQQQTIDHFRQLHDIHAVTEDSERLVVEKLRQVKSR